MHWEDADVSIPQQVADHISRAIIAAVFDQVEVATTLAAVRHPRSEGRQPQVPEKELTCPGVTLSVQRPRIQLLGISAASLLALTGLLSFGHLHLCLPIKHLYRRNFVLLAFAFTYVPSYQIYIETSNGALPYTDAVRLSEVIWPAVCVRSISGVGNSHSVLTSESPF